MRLVKTCLARDYYKRTVIAFVAAFFCHSPVVNHRILEAVLRCKTYHCSFCAHFLIYNYIVEYRSSVNFETVSFFRSKYIGVSGHESNVVIGKHSKVCWIDAVDLLCIKVYCQSEAIVFLAHFIKFVRFVNSYEESVLPHFT